MEGLWGVSKTFKALIYKAHRVVIFAIAQYSCISGCMSYSYKTKRLQLSFTRLLNYTIGASLSAAGCCNYTHVAMVMSTGWRRRRLRKMDGLLLCRTLHAITVCT